MGKALYWLMRQGDEAYCEGPVEKPNTDTAKGEPRKKIACANEKKEVIEHLIANLVTHRGVKARQ